MANDKPETSDEAEDGQAFSAAPCSDVWDNEENEYACNWDGTLPKVTNGGTVLIMELGCNCAPPGCGGCIDVWNEYELGKRYVIRPNAPDQTPRTQNHE